jgi:hypothetical protein
MVNDDESQCGAGSFITPCNKIRCYKLPGEPCKDKATYGQKCHPSLVCMNGICTRELTTLDGKTLEHWSKSLPIGKRSHPKFAFIDYTEDNNSNALDYPKLSY